MSAYGEGFKVGDIVSRHCKTCRCGQQSAGDRFPLAAMRWLLHYGDGLPLATIARLTGQPSVQPAIVALEVDRISFAIVADPVRHVGAFRGERFERLRAAGCFGGLRKSGQPKITGADGKDKGEAGHPREIGLPPYSGT